jgi:hypothetical protein
MTARTDLGVLVAKHKHHKHHASRPAAAASTNAGARVRRVSVFSSFGGLGDCWPTLGVVCDCEAISPKCAHVSPISNWPFCL